MSEIMNKPVTNIIRSNRKTISLQVREDGTLLVRAPFRMTDAAILGFIQSHQQWIDRHVSEMEQRRAEKAPAFTAEDIHTMAEETRRFLPPLLDQYSRALGVRPSRVTVRNQKTRWGSCSSQGGLNFNCLLVLAPDYVRRYVVIHELCHLREMNHSPAFWDLVASQMPDYRKAKEWLKTEGKKLIARL